MPLPRRPWPALVHLPRRTLHASARLLSAAGTDKHTYAGTLRLPATPFQLWAAPDKREAPFRKRTCEELYRWQWEYARGGLFVLHDGPPYANGDLHMGHALNKIIKDIINRFHLSLGQRVHYAPGWDCHGLPIENKALQALGKDPWTLPPSTIRAEAKKYAQKEVVKQREEFRKLGIMADWENEAATYRTIDHDYEIRQLEVFQKMVENGLIYRDHRPVHYSPSSRSALAEAELTYQDNHVSHSVYVTFRLDGKSGAMSPVLRALVDAEREVQLLVWTTTPWTLTANMGIAVHEDMVYSVIRQSETGRVLIAAKDRLGALEPILGATTSIADVSGFDLLNASYLPIFSTLPNAPVPSAPLRILHAPHVTADSGTGLVHCAPAHGAEDYAAFRGQGLLPPGARMLCHVDDTGAFSADVEEVVGKDRAGTLLGKEVLKDGGRAAVELLKEVGALVKVQRVKHRYPYDWKTNEPIIVRATSQWFANLDQIKSAALNALDDVRFLPAGSRTRLESFVRGRSEWCISRQRVWGVPIPALHHTTSGRAVLDAASLAHIVPVLREKGVQHWWDGPVDDFLPAHLSPDGGKEGHGWEKGKDTMDVWFDSGASWALVRDLVQAEGAAQGRKHLADVCVEGSDQHRGWFQSQLLTAVGSAEGEKRAPYGTLVTHGMVLDQKGKKMSKSEGNIVSPRVVLEGGKDLKKEPAYGAEVLRLWAATVEYWRDVPLGNATLGQTADALRKLRNTARFMLGNLGEEAKYGALEEVPKENLGLAERYVMHELQKLEAATREAYAAYNFPKVVNLVSNFGNITLSTLYFDITKDCLYANATSSLERRAVATVLEKTLTTMTRILAPILPHLAEEIHQCRANEHTASSIFMTPWTPLGDEWHDPVAAQEFTDLLRVRTVVLGLLEQARQAKQIGSSLEAEVDIIVPGDMENKEKLLEVLQREEDFLKTLFIVSDAQITDEGSLGTSSPAWTHVDSVAIPGCDFELGVRVRPAAREKCPRCWTFTRAPQDDLCGRCSSVLDS